MSVDSVELKMDVSGGELQPSEADSLFHAESIKLSEENIVTELKVIMGDAKANNVNSTSEATNGVQLVEELHQQGTEPEVGKEANLQDNEIGISVLPTEINKKAFDFVATISEHDDILKYLPQQESETELAVPSVEVTKNLIAAEVEPMSKADGVDIIVLLDHETTGLQIVEGLHQQDSEAKSSDENIVASMKAIVVDLSQLEDETHPAFLGKNSIPVVETQVQVINSDVLMVTEITEELESLNRQTDCTLKKIDEIAKQEVAIDKGITDMEYQCSKYKCRHADYIEFYKFIVESRLPLHTHRDIKLMMKKKDNEAQKFLFKSFDLQIKIEAQTKLKLTLQEERRELTKQVEALKLQTESKLTQTHCRKRKTPDKPQVHAKRIALDTAGNEPL